MPIKMPPYAKELPFFGLSHDLEPLEAMRPTRIALPLLAAGFLLAPHAARGQTRRASLQAGVELLKKGRESEALAIFRRLTEDEPRFLEAWNNRAALEAAKGDLEAAQLSLEKALAANPDVSLVSRNLEKLRSRLARIAYDTAFGTSSKLPPLLLDIQREPISNTNDSIASRQRDSLAAELARVKEALRQDLSRKDSAVASRDFEIRRLKTELDRASAEVAATKAQAATLASAEPVRPQPATQSLGLPIRTAVEAPLAPDRPHVTEPAQVLTPPASPPVAATTVTKPAVAKPVAKGSPKPLAKSPETPVAVLSTLQAWAKAWSAQDVDQYLSYYSDRFVPIGKPDRKSWEDYRRERITAPKSISVEIVAPKIRMLKGHHAEVVYRQVYQTEESRLTSRKRLELAWEQGVWRIFAEKEAR